VRADTGVRYDWTRLVFFMTPIDTRMLGTIGAMMETPVDAPATEARHWASSHEPFFNLNRDLDNGGRPVT